jgi:hypothetical protein
MDKQLVEATIKAYLAEIRSPPGPFYPQQRTWEMRWRLGFELQTSAGLDDSLGED